MGNPMASNHGPTKNPWHSTANQWLPRSFLDVIRWARFISVSSPLATEVIRKFSTYPITEFTYEAQDPAVKSKYEEIVRSFRLRNALHNIGMQYHSVGNVFLSIYYPIHRSYVCPSCGTQYNSTNAEFLKFKNYSFHGECPHCSSTGQFIIRDSKSLSIQDMNLVMWDATNIAVAHNPISGKSKYYYKIPGDIKKKILTGDRLFLDTIPWEFVTAVKNGQDFEFGENQIFHMKNVDAVGSIEGVAIPPIISHFSLCFYTATLRKANESVANDYMAPLRAIFPQPQTANSDPVVSISMSNFVGKMEQALVQHRRDNNHVLIAPVPIGYQAISGEGKALLVSQEIAQAEETLLLSMGVSRELLSGQTNWTSSTIGLRMLRNSLDNYVLQVEELLDWITSRVAAYLAIPFTRIRLTPFQLTDDDNLKQVGLSLAQAGNMSMTTLYQSLGKDYAEELEKIAQDAKRKARHDVLMKYQADQAAYLAGMEINQRNQSDSSYQDILQQAQSLAEEIMGADETTSRQVLNQLKVTDYAKYLMVAKLVEEGRTAVTQQQNMAMAQDAAQNPSAPNSPTQAQGAGAGPAQPTNAPA